MNKKYYWLKLKTDFFTSKAMKKLRRIAGGDTYTIIYLKLQLLSLQNEGILFYEGVEPSFYEEMALTLDEDAENVRATLIFLENTGLLEKHDETEYKLTEVPLLIGSEGDSAERVRRHREKKALLCNNDVTERNAIETNCNTEIDIEKEKETEKELETEKKKKQAQAPYFEDPELNTAFCEYVKFRKKIKAPLTDYAIKMAIIKINNLAAGDTQKAIAIVNQSILRGWRGFFPLEENKKNTKADELNDFYAMAQAWAGGDNVQS